MKTVALAVSFVAISVVSAAAADMAVKARAPVMVPVSYDWSGFYVGGYAGGAWGQSDRSLNAANPTTNTFYNPANIPGVIAAFGTTGGSSSGFTGGGQIGYDWQSLSPWVFGLEADFGAFQLNHIGTNTSFYTFNPLDPFTQTSSAKTEWLFTARPRVGVAADNWLFYATGGVAVTEIKTAYTYTDNVFQGFVAGGSSRTRAGWTAGGGVEWAPLRNDWTVKVEYLHLDFGNAGDTATMTGFVGPVAPIFKYSANLRADTVRAGLNYKFSGPVIAKY
jgi:outer membrane immunogenic protein